VSSRTKISQILSKSNTEKAELNQTIENLKDENILLKSENDDFRNQLQITLAKKDELRDLLKEKLKDASKFK
jgi:predicted transcriptional regulator